MEEQLASIGISLAWKETVNDGWLDCMEMKQKTVCKSEEAD